MSTLETIPDMPNQEVSSALLSTLDPSTITETILESEPETPAIHPMEAWLNEVTFSMKELEVGDTVEGVVVGVNDSEILVDIGTKSEGVIPIRDLDKVDPDIRESLQPGASVFVQVVKPDSQDGHAVLSLSRALAEYDWQSAEKLLESQDIIEGIVNGYNKGGLIVFIGKARGFVPASQLVSDEGRKNDDSEDRFADMVGHTLQLKVIEIDRSRNRLILSERQAMRDYRRLAEGETAERFAHRRCAQGDDQQPGVVRRLCRSRRRRRSHPYVGVGMGSGSGSQRGGEDRRRGRGQNHQRRP